MFRVVFWDILPPSSGSTHLWNVGRQLFYTAVYPRRQLWTSYSLPWELEISQKLSAQCYIFWHLPRCLLLFQQPSCNWHWNGTTAHSPHCHPLPRDCWVRSGRWWSAVAASRCQVQESPQTGTVAAVSVTLPISCVPSLPWLCSRTDCIFKKSTHMNQIKHWKIKAS
jgi:hypothetical protein